MRSAKEWLGFNKSNEHQLEDLPEHWKKHALETIRIVELVQNEAFDAGFEAGRQEAFMELESLKELVKNGLPEECVLGYTEIKFCHHRNSDDARCKQCL